MINLIINRITKLKKSGDEAPHEHGHHKNLMNVNLDLSDEEDEYLSASEETRRNIESAIKKKDAAPIRAKTRSAHANSESSEEEGAENRKMKKKGSNFFHRKSKEDVKDHHKKDHKEKRPFR